MRAIPLAVAGLGVMAGLVLGTVVAGFPPGVEAAPKNQQGRLVELGAHELLAQQVVELAVQDVSDCGEVLLLAQGDSLSGN